MSNSRYSNFDRKSSRSSKKVFLLSTEGAVTEPGYFEFFSNYKDIKIRTVKPKKGKSSPIDVLKRMNKALVKSGLKTRDEAWIVIDTDQWKVNQFREVQNWANSKGSGFHRGVAISNPKFEYWLLLHFEDVKGGEAAEKCADRLKKLFPGYEKEIDTRKITEEMIKTAVDRAKNRYKKVSNPYKDSIAFTSVYKLVDSILKSSKKSAS